MGSESFLGRGFAGSGVRSVAFVDLVLCCFAVPVTVCGAVYGVISGDWRALFAIPVALLFLGYLGYVLYLLSKSYGQAETQMVNYVLDDKGVTIRFGPDTPGLIMLIDRSGGIFIPWEAVQSVGPVNDKQVLAMQVLLPGKKPGGAFSARKQKIRADLKSAAGDRVGDRLLVFLAAQKPELKSAS